MTFPSPSSILVAVLGDALAWGAGVAGLLAWVVMFGAKVHRKPAGRRRAPRR